MEILTIIFLALALSADALAVSMCFGISASNEDKTKTALKAGAFFGLFQAVMPLIGWTAGYYAKNIIENYDHWLAFGLLFFIGSRMIYQAIKKNDCKTFDTNSIWIMLSLSIATSIDALAVGLSLALIKMPVLLSVSIIGFTTFLLSFAGVLVGKKFYKLLGNKAEYAGGIILICIGVKIIIEHLSV